VTSRSKAFHSLAARDLQRGHAVGLPSGEAIARHIGATPLTREQTALARWAGIRKPALVLRP